MSCPYCYQPQPNTIHTSSSQFTKIQPPWSANVVVQHTKYGNEQLAGNRSLDNCEMPPTSFENQEEEVACICGRMRQLDEMVSRSKGRVALQRRFNPMQSPTSVLPPEILAVIFKHVCYNEYYELPETELPQLVLGAVSSLWRQVVQSTPILWASAAFDFQASSTREEAALLRLFLENSGNLPLTLRFHFMFSPLYDPDDDTLVHPTIDELLIMNLPRVQELHLILPSKKWLYSTHRLSQLTTFSLGSFTGDFSLLGHGLLFQNSPFLRQLRLSLVSQEQHDASLPVHIDLPFAHTITILDLDMVPAHICIELLTRCSNLIECSICPDGLEAGVQLPKIVLPHLEVLSFDATKSTGDRSILPYIHTPSLRTLDLAADDSASTRSFFTRLPPTLSTLELHWYRHTLLELVRKDSGVETLKLVNCDPETVLDLLLKLRSYDQREDKPLPRLKNLFLGIALEVWTASQYMDPDTSLDIARTLCKRMNDPNSDEFCLTVDLIPVKWLRRAKRELKKLVNLGFKIEISQREDDRSDFETLDL